MRVKLTDSEWKIMELLWEEAPRTMTQITEKLKEETRWSKHTVMTFLKRMEDKGAIHYAEGTRAKLYYPDLRQEDAVLQEAEEFLGKVFRGRIGLMVNAMVRQNALTEEELAELKDILREADKNGEEGNL